MAISIEICVRDGETASESCLQGLRRQQTLQTRVYLGILVPSRLAQHCTHKLSSFDGRLISSRFTWTFLSRVATTGGRRRRRYEKISLSLMLNGRSTSRHDRPVCFLCLENACRSFEPRYRSNSVTLSTCMLRRLV